MPLSRAAGGICGAFLKAVPALGEPGRTTRDVIRGTFLDVIRMPCWLGLLTQRSSFSYFETSPEIIRLAMMLHFRFPLSLRNVENLLLMRDNEISRETGHYWWTQFGRMLAAELRRKWVDRTRGRKHWRLHLDQVFLKINGVRRYPLLQKRSVEP